MSASPMAAAMLAEQARAWARVAVIGAVGARLKAALDLQRGEAGEQERAARVIQSAAGRRVLGMKLFNMRAAMIVLRRNLQRYVARHSANRENISADRVKTFLEAVAKHKDVRRTAPSHSPRPNSKPRPKLNPSPNLNLKPDSYPNPNPELNPTPNPNPQPGEQDDQELHLQDQHRPAHVPLVPVQAARAAQCARAAVRQAGAHTDTQPLTAPSTCLLTPHCLTTPSICASPYCSATSSAQLAGWQMLEIKFIAISTNRFGVATY